MPVTDQVACALRAINRSTLEADAASNTYALAPPFWEWDSRLHGYKYVVERFELWCYARLRSARQSAAMGGHAPHKEASPGTSFAKPGEAQMVSAQCPGLSREPPRESACAVQGRARCLRGRKRAYCGVLLPPR